MAKVFLSTDDEKFSRVLRDKGLGVPNAPHWLVARIALAKSLQMPQFPEEDLSKPLGKDRALEIHMAQLAGENNPVMEDRTDQFRVLLGTYHQEDLFADYERFVELIQRHIQRGLGEIKNSWRQGNDLFDYLYQELFFEWTRSGDRPA